eukprot:4102754-Karenia_brevis.AAC.1
MPPWRQGLLRGRAKPLPRSAFLRSAASRQKFFVQKEKQKKEKKKKKAVKDEEKDEKSEEDKDADAISPDALDNVDHWGESETEAYVPTDSPDEVPDDPEKDEKDEKDEKESGPKETRLAKYEVSLSEDESGVEKLKERSRSPRRVPRDIRVPRTPSPIRLRSRSRTR